VGNCEPSLADLLALRARAQALATGARRRSADRAAGTRHSPFRGRGMDYAESRAYASGDDVRHVDWRLTARAGELHTKLFAAERERTSAVLLDTAPALRFGTRQGFKSVQAAKLAALFLWFAQSEGDRVCAAAFGPVGGQLPPQGTHRGVVRALAGIEQWSRVTPRGGTALTLSAAADRLGRVLQGGGHILLLLEASSMDADALRALTRLRRDPDLAALVLADPLEREPLPRGRYRIETPRGPSELASDGELAAWQFELRARQQQAVDALRRMGAGVRIASTRDDPLRVLQDLLRGRPQEAA
jgi:uncharacterized protein (DUF58 family)